MSEGNRMPAACISYLKIAYSTLLSKTICKGACHKFKVLIRSWQLLLFYSLLAKERKVHVFVSRW